MWVNCDFLSPPSNVAILLTSQSPIVENSRMTHSDRPSVCIGVHLCSIFRTSSQPPYAQRSPIGVYRCQVF
ncbi:hypothetical protein [Fischerella thermalis]|uniref:hypothetical protein n=1 Tax=Fischerella thermalis TaxID=372787 RepID=UPI0011AF4D56|nr:hypothetical protein [Fischerella thermalis]MBF1991244.1 hypothetical protein [Fischerella thermalis M58_A2018_009]MBF2061500.1 hypothetical protein [Fischerella thermalis M66_A2018_004]MBF2072080.1 hypothetical protein [Fischerella thermalis M48_A2018_028]